MTKTISLFSIRLALAADPDSLSIENLRLLLDPQPAHRTLQRRLAELLAVIR